MMQRIGLVVICGIAIANSLYGMKATPDVEMGIETRDACSQARYTCECGAELFGVGDVDQPTRDEEDPGDPCRQGACVRERQLLRQLYLGKCQAVDRLQAALVASGVGTSLVAGFFLLRVLGGYLSPDCMICLGA